MKNYLVLLNPVSERNKQAGKGKMVPDAGVRYFRVTCVTSVWCNPFYFLLAKVVLLLCRKLRCFLVTSCLLPCAKSCVTSCDESLLPWGNFFKQNATSFWHESHYFRLSSYILRSNTVFRIDQKIKNSKLFVNVFQGSICNMLVRSFALCFFIATLITVGKRTTGSLDSTPI